MGPVRVGNAAFTQIQHDAYGQIVLSNAQAFFDQRLFRAATEADFEALEKVGALAWQTHDQPDAGLWEFRTRASVHTYSAVMSWAACDRLANIAETLGLAPRAKLWRERADTIAPPSKPRPGSRRTGASPQLRSDELDASCCNCRHELSGGRRSRFIAHLRGGRKGPQARRAYAAYAAEDDFGRPETAFNFCHLLVIEALHLAGRGEEARALYERMLERLTPAGLLSEDTDFVSGELWGNYPQTYSLVGLINCAGLLSRPWSSVR